MFTSLTKLRGNQSGIGHVMAVVAVVVVAVVGFTGYRLQQLSHADTATFGVSTIGSKTENLNFNYKIGSSASPTSAGQLTSVSAYLDGNATTTGSGTVAAAVYSDASGKPSALLASSASQTIAAKKAAGWMTFTLTSPLNVTAGTKYWLTLSAGTKTVVRIYHGTTASGQVWASNGSSVTPTTTFGAANAEAGPLSAYANYTTAATTPAGLSLTNLSATVSGTSVSTTTTVASNPAATAAYYSVCVRDASGANLDYDGNTNVTLSTTGATYTGTKTFAAGTYTYFACAQINGVWPTIGASKTFTVTGTGTTTPPPATTAHDYVQDFTTAVAAWPANGSAPSGYGPSGVNTGGFCAYADGTSSKYYPSQVASVHDGYLDLYDHSAMAAAILPFCYDGFTYGTYSVTMRLSGTYSGYHNAFLLWPNTDQWTHEFDYPEEETSASNPYVAIYQGTGKGFLPATTTRTPSSWADGKWHTYTQQWGPGFLKAYQDGVLVATVTSNIPSAGMHPVLQNEFSNTLGSGKPSTSLSGHTYVDRVTYDKSYTLDPSKF